MGNTGIRPYSEMMVLLRQAVKALAIDLASDRAPHPGTIGALDEVAKEMIKHQAIYEELLSQATNTTDPKSGVVEYMKSLVR